MVGIQLHLKKYSWKVEIIKSFNNNAKIDQNERMNLFLEFKTVRICNKIKNFNDENLYLLLWNYFKIFC